VRSGVIFAVFTIPAIPLWSACTHIIDNLARSAA
jgi:hypothetical protein